MLKLASYLYIRICLASDLKQVLIFLKLIYEKILYTWAKKISQHSESSLETKVSHHSNCNVRYAGFIRGIS